MIYIFDTQQERRRGVDFAVHVRESHESIFDFTGMMDESIFRPHQKLAMMTDDRQGPPPSLGSIQKTTQDIAMISSRGIITLAASLVLDPDYFMRLANF